MYESGAQRVVSAPGASVSQFLEQVKADLFLKQACPGSKFAAVFLDQQNQGYVVTE
jgi:hypothetical protein